jgi:CubicO group peptidase (beta-lactamase class C family)
MDPDWKTSWGLGFSVYQSNGKTMVGHGGSCPGYRSTLSIDPKSKRAVIVMINASGTNPGTYARALHKIWAKDSPEETDQDLTAFTGTYNSQPWWGEYFVMPWGDQLISISIPNDSPDDFTKLKHIEGDHFRKVRDNDELGEEIIFSRDASGKVYRMSWHNNHRTKISLNP